MRHKSLDGTIQIGRDVKYKLSTIKTLAEAFSWFEEREPIFIDKAFYRDGSGYEMDQLRSHIEDGRLYRAIKVNTAKVTLYRHIISQRGGRILQTSWNTDSTVTGYEVLHTETKEVEYEVK